MVGFFLCDLFVGVEVYYLFGVVFGCGDSGVGGLYGGSRCGWGFGSGGGYGVVFRSYWFYCFIVLGGYFVLFEWLGRWE